MAYPNGEPLSRELRYRVAEKTASTATLTALPAAHESRADGCITVVAADSSLWVFDLDATDVAQSGVLVPDSGSGRWFQAGGGGAALAGGGAQMLHSVRGASTADVASLAAFTVANDGITFVETERVLLKNQTSTEENGIYVCGVVAGGTCALTRAIDADGAAEISPGMSVFVSEGTAAADNIYLLYTNEAIVVDTTGLVFTLQSNPEDLAATTVGLGGDLIGLYDVGGKVTATTCGAAIIENRTALDVAEGTIVTHTANIATLRPGIPMQSRLRMLGAPGAIVAGNTVTIGADVYEFRGDTPPSGGTAGRIWIYNGANSAASRANFINAVNNVTDAPNITYDGAVTETMLAAAGVTTGDVIVQSSNAVGGATPTPSATATATTEVLTTAADIWDHTAMQYGELAAAAQAATVAVTLGAQEMAKTTMEVYFDFTPTKCLVVNRSQAADEGYTISGNAVSITLAGGGAPNHQSGDVLDISAWE